MAQMESLLAEVVKKIMRISQKTNITIKIATKLTLTRALASCNNLRCAALSFMGSIFSLSSKVLISKKINTQYTRVRTHIMQK
jgi:hypothetical protein